jgi:dipeptidyl aminopeptidase/acylaminoacyl peptidase
MVRLLPILLACAAALGAQNERFDVQALLSLARISEADVSPEGKLAAFTVQKMDLAKNGSSRQIYLVPVDGGAPAQITAGGNNSAPQFSPDSKRIAFISTRSGSSQVWTMNPDGGEARQITSLATEAHGVIYSPTGKHLLFVSEVYPDCPDDACNKKRLDAENESKVKARVYTSLLYRHWNQWQGKRRKHLMWAPVEGGAPKDLTPGNYDAPPFSLRGDTDYAISPDGKEVCFVMNTDPDPAVSTNSDLYVVSTEGGEPRKITVNPAADKTPQYSPDGKWLAYLAQLRPGYESDRWRLMVMERSTGKATTLTENLDRLVTGFTWSPDSARIFFTVEDRGRTSVQMAPVTGGAARVIVSGSSHIQDVHFAADGKTMVYVENTGSRPNELFRASSGGGTPAPLSRLNDAALAKYRLSPLEEFWVDRADEARVHSFVVKPPDFDPKRRYPVLFLIHGGPQGAWGESWTYRWNAQVFAQAGYLVVLPNPRGSTGYGQKFTDEINADWGGKVFDDILAVVDHVEKLPYADPGRMAAAGGSYGGYMADWLLGHTDRFKALVSHAGVYDLRSMAGETEELWFPLWEFRGMPWDNPEIYAKWSPGFYVKDFKTPTLVLHGELDYRVPVGQAMQLFTALQMQKVPSKMVLFPDEGHWINKPQNSVLWYTTFLDWIGEWTRTPGP